MDSDDKTQRIARLTPLDHVLARIDALVKPAGGQERPVTRTRHRAHAVEWPMRPQPETAISLRDGYAVSADATLDASAYAPVRILNAARIDVGEPLPPRADAVAPLDIVLTSNGAIDIIAPLAAGDGVLPASADGDPAHFRRWQERIADSVGAGRANPAPHRRAPQVCILRARAEPDRIFDAIQLFLAVAIERCGGIPVDAPAADLASAMASGADAVIVIGGTGSGLHDASATMLAAQGHIEIHGMAISPGETAGFGMARQRPVLLLPGRLDSAIAVWLAVGRHLLARLNGIAIEARGRSAVLARKIASPLGLAEIVPVRSRDGKAHPIASGYWPIAAIAETDGWIFIPPDSEGFPEGAQVVIRPLL